MCTYGNGVGKVRLIRSGIQGFDCFRNKNIIGSPASVWRITLNVHQFLAGESIKSHHGKGIDTAVKVTAVVMYGVGSISDGSQISSSALAVCLFQDCFIRILAGSEVLHTHTGENFKLSVCGSCANNRNCQVTTRVVLLEIVEGRNRILIIIQKLDLIRITE